MPDAVSSQSFRLASGQMSPAGGSLGLPDEPRSCVDLRLARRGGVAIGDIYHDDEAVFGPGLVRAYDIESNVAKFPRIVVDHEVLDTCGPISGFNVFEDGLHF